MLRPALALLLLAGCATFPQVDAAGRAFTDAPAPQLLPTARILALGEAPPGGAEAAQAALTARAAALRNRAAAIRNRPVS